MNRNDFVSRMSQDDFVTGETFSIEGFRFLVIEDINSNYLTTTINRMYPIVPPINGDDGVLDVQCSMCRTLFNAAQHGMRTDTTDCYCPKCGFVLSYPRRGC